MLATMANHLAPTTSLLRAIGHRVGATTVFVLAATVAAMSATVLLATTVPAAAETRQWVSPIGHTSRPDLVRDFEPPEANWHAGHRGVDLRASPGQPVVSAGSGEVTYAAHLVDRGVVVVSHGQLRTTFEPVDPLVTVGQRVDSGQQIGVVGLGGHCSVRCVHWGLRRGADYLDPLLLITLRPPVLKSLAGSSAVDSGATERRERPAFDLTDPTSRNAPTVSGLRTTTEESAAEPGSSASSVGVGVGLAVAATALTGGIVTRRRLRRI